MYYLVISVLILSTASVHGGHDLSKEYRFQRVLDSEESYVLYWSFDLEAGTIAFAVNVSTTGWVGFGLSPNGQMPLSDVVIGWVDDEGQSQFHDRFADGRVEPSIDESQDWFLKAHSEEDGRTILEFTRVLIPCDESRDIDITANTSRIIWSYSTTDPEGIAGLDQHTKQGSVSINLLDDQNDNSQDVEGELFFDITSYNVTIPSNVDTTYWCQIVELPEDLTSAENQVYIFRQAAKLTSHDRNYVHHMLAYICPKISFSNFSGSCDDEFIPDEVCDCRNRNIFNAWGIGGEDLVYPEGVGFPIGGHNNARYVLLEIHYDNPDLTPGVIDDSGFRYYYTTTVPTHEAGLMIVGHSVTRTMIVPPSSPAGYTIFGVCEQSCTEEFFPDEGITVFASILHTRHLGSQVTLRHYRPSDDCGGLKELEPIEQNLRYDFNFQQTNPVQNRVIKPGDTLVVECFYNSSRSTITVGGERTQEEMCLSYITYYPRIDLSFCLNSPSLPSLGNFIFKYFPDNPINVTTNFFGGIDDDFNSLTWTPTALSDLASAANGGMVTLCGGSNIDHDTEDRPFPEVQCPYEAPPRMCTPSSSLPMTPSVFLTAVLALVLLTSTILVFAAANNAISCCQVVVE